MRKVLYLLWGSAVVAASVSYASPTCVSVIGQPASQCESASRFATFSLAELDSGLLIAGVASAENTVVLDLNALIGQDDSAHNRLQRSGSGSNGRVVAAEFGEGELSDFGRVHMARVPEGPVSFGHPGFGQEVGERSEDHDSGHGSPGVTGLPGVTGSHAGDDRGKGDDRGARDDNGDGVSNGAVVPEPVSFLLIGSGLLLLGLFWRRKHA